MLISKFDNKGVEDLVKELEERYAISLPDKYRLFLLKYNGGETPETEFRINGVASDIQGFYGVGNANKNYNFDSLITSERMPEWINNKMFPIATNIFGDYIMICVDGECRERIFFVYHDRQIKYIELAEDFWEFIKKCKSKKIGHIRTIEERKNDLIKLGKGHKITPEKIAGWQAEINEYSNIHQEEVVIG